MNPYPFKPKLCALVVLPLLFTCLQLESFAQKVQPVETSKTVAGKVVKGHSITLSLDAQTIEKAWLKYLKEFGKTEKTGGFTTISSASSPRISSLPVKIFANAESASGGLTLWWGFTPASDSLPPLGVESYKESGLILKEFGKRMYIEDINKDIEQAEKALQTTVKQYEKAASTGASLEKAYNKNLGDSVTLVKKTQENVLQREQIRKNIQQNTLEQESSLLEIEKMKRARDLIREKLKRVE